MGKHSQGPAPGFEWTSDGVFRLLTGGLVTRQMLAAQDLNSQLQRQINDLNSKVEFQNNMDKSNVHIQKEIETLAASLQAVRAPSLSSHFPPLARHHNPVLHLVPWSAGFPPWRVLPFFPIGIDLSFCF